MEPSVAVQARRHITSGGDHLTSSASGSGGGRGGRRTSTREKIARMVAEGANNYPSYLKLIYTGDSEEPSSSEDELGAPGRTSGHTVSASGSGARGDGRPGRGNVVHRGGDVGTASSVGCRDRRQTAKTTSQSPFDGGSNCPCHHDSMSLVTNHLVLDFIVTVIVVVIIMRFNVA